MATGMTSRGIALWVVLLFIGLAMLLVHNILWHEFISRGFEYNGEDYFKSEGLILRDDFLKGFILTIGDPLTFWFSIAFITLTLLPPERVTFQIVGILTTIYAAGVLLYGVTKSYDLYQGTFDNQERVIAIVSAGLGRIIGVVIGAWLAVQLDAYGRLMALISRARYDKQLHRLN